MKQDFLEKELAGIEGEFKGLGLRSYADFILQKHGMNDWKKVEKAMIEAGYPLKYKEIKNEQFYPLKMEAALLIIINEIFKYKEKEMEEMGRFQAKSPFIVRIFVKYLFSFKKAIVSVPEMWRKWFTKGDLKVTDYNQEKKYVVLRLDSFFGHPFICQTRVGYFAAATQMIVGKHVLCKETKCIHRGNDYHEFFLEW